MFAEKLQLWCANFHVLIAGESVTPLILPSQLISILVSVSHEDFECQLRLPVICEITKKTAPWNYDDLWLGSGFSNGVIFSTHLMNQTCTINRIVVGLICRAYHSYISFKSH